MKAKIIFIGVVTSLLVSCKTIPVKSDKVCSVNEDQILVSNSFISNSVIMRDLLLVFKDSLNNHIGCSDFEYYKVNIKSNLDTLYFTLQTILQVP